MRVRKPNEYKFKRMNDSYPWYARLLARYIVKVPELPDFSSDDGLFIMSDFGGEHKGADFSTYAFLILSADKRFVFEEHVKELRKKYSLNEPFKELNYKDLRYGPIKRALSDYLELVDKYIHGALVTVSIDRNIETVFGLNAQASHKELVALLSNHGFSGWKGKDAEKLFRVLHPLCMFLSALGHHGQKALWLCDNDTINVDGNERSFEDTQKIYGNVLKMYCDYEFDILGFAKPFDKDPLTSDLLSVTDFAAGTIQDILQSHVKKKDYKGNESKIKLVKWMAKESSFLSKINLVITKLDDGDWGCGTVQLGEKI
ncbi:hypothetical protein H8R01_15680 [Vibrio metschnikovii]|uniref:hypothetical protein n=1 Tax=Vibrio metschnikovii TaxID=28172 RepID=UPI0016445D65|nr:hypothetical protein [Vibrio metschnikovii]MBC3618706.1 hypothetical protein [Vibrio metschnikovii]MBC5814739.1 hypothetical protein [Vibrio metschnikovii]